MLRSYKIELFLLPICCTLFLLALDISTSEYNFSDYLGKSNPEDITLFWIIVMMMWMFCLVFFHFYRIIELGKIKAGKTKINRIILLFYTFSFFVLIVASTILGSENELVLLVIIVSFITYWIYYFINFYLECRLMNINNSTRTLIDELHDQ